MSDSIEEDLPQEMVDAILDDPEAWLDANALATRDDPEGVVADGVRFCAALIVGSRLVAGGMSPDDVVDWFDDKQLVLKIDTETGEVLGIEFSVPGEGES